MLEKSIANGDNPEQFSQHSSTLKGVEGGMYQQQNTPVYNMPGDFQILQGPQNPWQPTSIGNHHMITVVQYYRQNAGPAVTLTKFSCRQKPGKKSEVDMLPMCSQGSRGAMDPSRTPPTGVPRTRWRRHRGPQIFLAHQTWVGLRGAPSRAGSAQTARPSPLAPAAHPAQPPA